jgi:chromosome partitioning protein
MTRVIAVVNQKGGVGKTTTTVNLSTALALKGKRVLVVDLDPQGNCTSSFGITKDDLARHAYHLLLGHATLKDVAIPTAVDGLTLIPTNTDLAGAEVELVSELGREGRLADALRGGLSAYDVVLMDCPPSLGLVTLNALTAADGVLVPLQCEFFALEGVSQLLRTLELVQARINPRVSLSGVVLTMYDKRNKLTHLVREEVARYFGARLFTTQIPRNVRLSESPSHGKPVALYDPRSTGAEAYSALADEFISAVLEGAK